MQIKVKKLHENAVIPKYSKPGDAGLDLTASSYEYQNGRHVYGTGLAFEIPEGFVGLIFPRSSIFKKDLRLTNCVGVVDSGFRGEVKFIFENDSMQMSNKVPRPFWDREPQEDESHELYKVGDRIGQLIVMPYPQVELEQVEELSSTERGDGGFGSSGK